MNSKNNDYILQGSSSYFDFDGNGSYDLIIPSINEDPENDNNLATTYNLGPDRNTNKKYIFQYDLSDDYKGNVNDILFKDFNNKTYVFVNPEISENNIKYIYPEIWIYTKEENPQIEKKIKLKRDTNLIDQPSVINGNNGKHIVDLDNDGKEEFIIGMYDSEMSNNESFSIHIFNENGDEVTKQWFNNRDFADNLSNEKSYFDVIDINNDGFKDIFFRNKFRVDKNHTSILLNNGSSFKLIQLKTENDGYSIPYDINNDKEYEFFSFWVEKESKSPDDLVKLYYIDYSKSSADYDGDGIVDDDDNCPYKYNPNQIDSDNDGIGDKCFDTDDEKDGIKYQDDNCPNIWNSLQRDNDGNGIGDLCDSNYIITSIDENAPIGYKHDISDLLPSDTSNLTITGGNSDSVFKLDGNNLIINNSLSFNDNNIYVLEIDLDSNYSEIPKNLIIYINYVLPNTTVKAEISTSSYLSSKFEKYIVYDPYPELIDEEKRAKMGNVQFSFGSFFGNEPT